MYQYYALKPCPFCGTKVNLEKIPLWHGSQGYHDRYEYKVHCEKCGCTLTYNRNDTIYRSEKKAIKNVVDVWNRRSK